VNPRSKAGSGFDERRSAAIRQMLVDAPQSGTETNKYFRHLRAAKIVVPSVVLALSVTAGAAVLLQAPVTDKNQVACFARAERSGDSFPGTKIMLGKATRVGEPDTGNPIPIEDALSACGSAWAQNMLDPNSPTGRTAPQEHDPTNSHPVPTPLTVCVWDGIAAVIPGDSKVCAKAGLSERSNP